MKTFETKEVVAKLNDHCCNFSSKSDFVEFEARVIPRIEAANTLVLGYRAENSKMMECVS
jgi:hypothetical protein